AVQVEAVPRFVLHLGDQDRLAPQRRRSRDPLRLRLHADDLRMGVLGDLADERRSVGVGHPVPRLDAPVRRNGALELLLDRHSPSGRCRRDWTIMKRPATKLPSVSVALAAGLPPVAWKSEKAADWLT